MKKSVYNELLARVEALEKLVNGGAGSGNFGHAGRPGKRGGSGSGIGGSSKAIATQKKSQDQEGVTKQKKDSSKKAGEKKMTKAEATEVLDKIADDIMGGTLEDYDYSFEKLISPVKSGKLSKKQARELMITGKPQLTTDKKTIYVATQTELHTWPTSPKDSSQTMKEARDYWREEEGDY